MVKFLTLRIFLILKYLHLNYRCDIFGILIFFSRLVSSLLGKVCALQNVVLVAVPTTLRALKLAWICSLLLCLVTQLAEALSE